MDQALLTTTEAARVLRIGKTSLYELVKRGDLAKVKIGTKTVRIPRAEIERYLASLTATSGERAV